MNDPNVLMVNFNAKVWNSNAGSEDIMGCQGLGEGNENGEKFMDLCATINLLTERCIFPHKRIYKATWVSLYHTKENQNDHKCINIKFRRSLQEIIIISKKGRCDIRS